MGLKRLDVKHIRNLSDVSLTDLSQFNIIYGANGSGKTSLLEAIHVLALARSFRSNKIKTLIEYGCPSCVVFGEYNSGRAQATPIGVERHSDGTIRIKISGTACDSIAKLAREVPLQLINSASFDLLNGTPKEKRSFIDWGVFHVEHGFIDVWQRFHRLIKQRNKLLRRANIHGEELSVWTTKLADMGEALNNSRQHYIDLLLPIFMYALDQLSPSLSGLKLRYSSGWDRSISYREALGKSSESDLELGFTQLGPQRANFKVVTEEGFNAADTLSRGQQKIVVCALKLAQGILKTKQNSNHISRELAETLRAPHGLIYLLDDLPAELDAEHCRRVVRLLVEIGAQVFITCIEPNQIMDVMPENQKYAGFHVEHGKIKATAVPN